MLKAILLDIDGTLVRSNDEHAQAWEDALRRFGYEVPWQEIRSWIGMGGDRILRRVDEGLDDKREPGVSISRVRQEIFLREYVPRLQPQDGGRALLTELEARSLRRIAATSAKREELDAILSAGDIPDCIDMATTSDDAERSKPDADVIEVALAKAELLRDEAIYIGDTPYDVAAAHKAQMVAIALRCGGWSDKDLRDAEAIYDSPAELLRRLDESPIGRAQTRDVSNFA
jgi:phosphoglycolate phosphatase-like HAD superfamily hydrolase